MQPASGFHGLEGLKHLPTALVPGIYDDSLADENLWIETEEAYHMVRRLAREEGLLVGVSAGANVAAALKVAKKIGPIDSAGFQTGKADGSRNCQDLYKLAAGGAFAFSKGAHRRGQG